MRKRKQRKSSDGSERVAEGSLYYFDEEAADRVVRFFERLLVHVEGEWMGQPVKLEAWQRELLARIFGWKRRADGTRRYRTVYVEMGRKNGKSFLAAGIALYLLLADGEPGAQVYSAAADRAQAALVFSVASKMVQASPHLASRCEVYKRTITVEATWSRYEVLSSDAPTKHGLNAHGIIFDELHAQPDRELWDVLRTSTGARRQPLIFVITTAGFDRDSICYEMHEYAVAVRDGRRLDDAFLPILYSADEADDWKSPETWRKANPNLGISIKLEALEQECREALDNPARENTFRRLHLSQWTEQDRRWLSLEAWDRCAEPVDPEKLRGRDCYAGLDLSSTTDISALALLFPPIEHDPYWRIVARFWIPSENITKRQRRDSVPFDAWVRARLVEATPGNVIDYGIIRRDIGELGNVYRIREIAIDRWNSTQLQTELDGDGFTVVPFGQGFGSMSSPTKALEGLVLGERLAHGANPVLRWMAGNVAVAESPAGDLKPVKDKSADRIDGIVASIMALGRAMVAPAHTSVYASRDLTVI